MMFKAVARILRRGEAKIPNLYNMIVVLNLKIVWSGACFPACLLFKYVIYSVFDCLFIQISFPVLLQFLNAYQFRNRNVKHFIACLYLMTYVLSVTRLTYILSFYLKQGNMHQNIRTELSQVQILVRAPIVNLALSEVFTSDHAHPGS